MSYINFCNQIRSVVQSMVGTDYNVRLVKVDKLNDTILQSIVILKNNETIAPNIYLEEYYSGYKEGQSIENLATEILSVYNKADNYPSIPVTSLIDFDSIKDQIFFKLINYERNQKLLKCTVHIKWLDFAVIFCVLVKRGTDGIGSFQIKNELLEMWGVDVNTVYEHAVANTPLLFSSSIRRMDDLIKDLVSDFIDDNEGTDTADIMKELFLPFRNNENTIDMIYVASNTSGVNGATCLLYKNELLNLSLKLGTDFYILPSSIHEVLLLPANKAISENALLNMVKEVNCTNVPVEDFLSDNVYYFDQKQNQIQALF